MTNATNVANVANVANVTNVTNVTNVETASVLCQWDLTVLVAQDSARLNQPRACVQNDDGSHSFGSHAPPPQYRSTHAFAWRHVQDPIPTNRTAVGDGVA